MSEKTAVNQSKPKLQLDGKYIARLAGTLLAICAVVAVLLGVVNHFTAPVIQEHQKAKTDAAMARVLEADTYDPLESSVPGVKSLYQATAGGKEMGYVALITADGFGGAMDMVVGIDMSGAVTGVAITANKETPNVGTKVVGDQNVLDRFVGMSHDKGEITVNGGANPFDGVSGATVSSKGVTAGINTALTAVEVYQGGNK